MEIMREVYEVLSTPRKRNELFHVLSQLVAIFIQTDSSSEHYSSCIRLSQ